MAAVNENLVQWSSAAMEEIVDSRRVANIAADILKAAQGIVSLTVPYELVITILGGRPPSKRLTAAARSTYGGGSWGVSTEAEETRDTARWREAVPLALGYVGAMLAAILGDGMGCSTDDQPDFGFAELAKEAIAMGLTDAHVRTLFVDIFQKLALEGSRFRTVVGAPKPDLITIIEEATADHLEPAAERQELAEYARKAAEAVIGDIEARLLAAGNLPAAGAKRNQPPAGKPPKQPNTSTATGLQPAAGQPATPPAGTPVVTGSRKQLRQARTAAAKAANAAAAINAAGAAPPGTPLQSALKTPTIGVSFAGTTPQPTTPVVAATPPPSTKAATTPSGAAWAPTWLANSITSFTKNPTSGPSAIDHFDFVCKQAGLTPPPCAFMSLKQAGCHGAPRCHRCAQAAANGTTLDPPAGTVAKIKAACNTNTAAMIAGP